VEEHAVGHAGVEKARQQVLFLVGNHQQVGREFVSFKA
jgi:hypothetical protein